jgi:hypothetical protein
VKVPDAGRDKHSHTPRLSSLRSNPSGNANRAPLLVLKHSTVIGVAVALLATAAFAQAPQRPPGPRPPVRELRPRLRHASAPRPLAEAELGIRRPHSCRLPTGLYHGVQGSALVGRGVANLTADAPLAVSRDRAK